MSNEAKTPGESAQVPAQDEADFDAMMEALGDFFHMAVCPNHSPAERTEAFKAAREAFLKFAYDGEDPDKPEVIGIVSAAPPTEPVLGDEDGIVLNSAGPKPGDKVH